MLAMVNVAIAVIAKQRLKLTTGYQMATKKCTALVGGWQCPEFQGQAAAAIAPIAVIGDFFYV